MTNEELILKHVRRPSGYAITDEKWRDWLQDSLDSGCDWLAYFVDRHNPTIAISVEEMCRRLEDQEARLASAEKGVEAADGFLLWFNIDLSPCEGFRFKEEQIKLRQALAAHKEASQ